MSTSYPLLVMTVGGAPEPIIASVLAHRPERLLFVVSPETRASVSEKIVPGLAAHETPFALDPGRFDFVELTDAQNFSACVAELRFAHGRWVQPWLERGPDYRVVVDFTGRTKCMTASLALVARRWDCQFSYVSGTERTKEGVGIVVSENSILRKARPHHPRPVDGKLSAQLADGESHGDCAPRLRCRVGIPSGRRQSTV